MGVYTRYTGRIDIDPPLPWNLIKDHPALPSDFESARNRMHGPTAGGRDVRLVIETREIDTEDGVLFKRTAVAIEPVTEDSFTGYDMQAHIQEVVDIDLARTYTGRIDAVCETAEQWRFKVVRTAEGLAWVERFEPVLTWPEKSE